MPNGLQMQLYSQAVLTVICTSCTSQVKSKQTKSAKLFFLFFFLVHTERKGDANFLVQKMHAQKSERLVIFLRTKFHTHIHTHTKQHMLYLRSWLISSRSELKGSSVGHQLRLRMKGEDEPKPKTMTAENNHLLSMHYDLRHAEEK